MHGQNEISLDQLIDRIIYKYYDSEYGRAFKYLLQFDINSAECVVPIEMLFNFAGMRPFSPSHTDQKLEELGLSIHMDYIKTESGYLLSPDAFIKYLKRTDEGVCFVDDYYNLLERVVHQYLQYQSTRVWPSYETTPMQLKLLELRLNNIDNSIIHLHDIMGELTMTTFIYFWGIVFIIGMVIVYELLSTLYWRFNW